MFVSLSGAVAVFCFHFLDFTTSYLSFYNCYCNFLIFSLLSHNFDLNCPALCSLFFVVVFKVIYILLYFRFFFLIVAYFPSRCSITIPLIHAGFFVLCCFDVPCFTIAVNFNFVIALLSLLSIHVFSWRGFRFVYFIFLLFFYLSLTFIIFFQLFFSMVVCFAIFLFYNHCFIRLLFFSIHIFFILRNFA